MDNYQRTKELVDIFVKEHGTDVEMTRSEFINWVHKTYENISTAKKNMSPTDICYNRYNLGLLDFPGESLCLEYIEERKSFRLIGSGYPYTGPVFAYKNRKNESIVGKWENGKYTWLTSEKGTYIKNNKVVVNQMLELKLENFKDKVHDGEEEILQKVKGFVEDYTVQKLMKLSKEEYVYGLGRKDTFCYRITHELMEWGSIRNGTPNKYGFYYNPNVGKYSAVSKFGDTETPETTEEAYKNVIKAICELIAAGGNGDYKSIQDNKLSTVFKMKLLCVYYPQKYLNVYSKEHMRFYMDKLNIAYSDEDGYMKWNEKIINWKNDNPIIKEWSNHEFSKFLYLGLGYPPDSEKQKKIVRKGEQKLDEILKEEIEELLEGDIEKVHEYIPKPERRAKPIISAEHYSYPRNKQVALNALMRAKYRCEGEKNGEIHPSFIRKSNDTNYTEPHHLIPMFEQDKYENCLDVPANVISLCSNCHNSLHYGKDPSDLLKKLYEARKDELHMAGIDITLEELIRIYL